MAFGVSQEYHALFEDQDVAASGSIQASVDTSKATELIFWVQNAASSPDEATWVLETKMRSSDASANIELDNETAGAGAFDNGDEFIIAWIPWAGQIRTFDYDDSAGTQTAASLTGVSALFALEQLVLTITAAATAGTYTFSAGVLIRG